MIPNLTGPRILWSWELEKLSIIPLKWITVDVPRSWEFGLHRVENQNNVLYSAAFGKLRITYGKWKYVPKKEIRNDDSQS